ncbi:YqaA family protein [Candidatus Latescibacterota bacterium]
MSRAGIHRRLYDWVLHWAETPYGIPALGIMAFAESSFFPIPPDVLLIALAIGIPKLSLRYSLVCTVGSVVGGMFGFFIGMAFFELVGVRILEFYGVMDTFEMVREMYLRYDVWFVGIAGFTPIPYKVFTIAAGAFGMNFPLFVAVSAVSRGTRFFILGGLIWKFGQPIRSFIDRYFNLLSILFFVLLALGFFVLKMFL